MTEFLRLLFFAVIVRPVVLLYLGLNVRHRERLPKQGPAIVVANHNSHLDTMVLMTLLPLSLLSKLRPVAAAGYFLKNRFLAWFATRIIGIIPVQHGTGKPREEVLVEVLQALDAERIVILFPEGTRGEPEQLSRFKSGIASLARMRPDVPVYPVYLHGLGKALPRGEMLLVPFFCDVFVGETLHWAGDDAAFMQHLDETMTQLAKAGDFSTWE